MNSMPGINIQWPWSQRILSGDKLVETRTYPLPEKYIGQELAIIETPGRQRKSSTGPRSAQIIGIVVFSGSFQYRSRAQWRNDKVRHCVDVDDILFGWANDRLKFGWEIQSVFKLRNPLEAPKRRGIIFASNCLISEESKRASLGYSQRLSPSHTHAAFLTHSKI